MRSWILLTMGACGLAQFAPVAHAAPRFATDVYPILRDNCVSCHREDDDRGDYRLDAFDLMVRGGEHGTAVVPGNASDSRMIKHIEGTEEPKMPPRKNLHAPEIKILRAWIDAGAVPPTPEEALAIAKNDMSLPAIKVTRMLPSPAESVTFSPDGRMLAIGRYQGAQLVDAHDGHVIATLAGATDVVRALAFSPNGRTLAGATGRPGRQGQIVLWDIATGAQKVIAAHKDTVHDVTFSPDGKLVASSSYDKLIKLWDAATGNLVNTLKEHTEAVYPIAFSPDGKRLASGASDRTVKIWDVASGKRVYTMTDCLDTVYTLAFDPNGRRLSAGSGDKMIRTWRLGPTNATLLRSTVSHSDAVLKIAYTRTGDRLASTSADHLVKIWDAKQAVELHVLDRQAEWTPTVAFSPDGQWLAIGRYDGTVALYDAQAGRKLRALPAGTPKIAAR